VFTPRVGAKHCQVDLNGMACSVAPTPLVGIVYI